MKDVEFNQVNMSEVLKSVDREHFFTAADGVFGEHTRREGFSGIIFGMSQTMKRVTFCVLILKNGYPVIGYSIGEENGVHDEESAKDFAREDAMLKLERYIAYGRSTREAKCPI